MSWSDLQGLRMAPRAEKNNPKIPRTHHDRARGYIVTRRGGITYAIDKDLDASLRYRIEDAPRSFPQATMPQSASESGEAAEKRRRDAKSRFTKHIRGGIVFKAPTASLNLNPSSSRDGTRPSDFKETKEYALIPLAQEGDLSSLTEIIALMEKNYTSNLSIIEELNASNREAEKRLEFLEKQL